ncbi:MAG: porin family protein [Bacteroidales bacterium]
MINSASKKRNNFSYFAQIFGGKKAGLIILVLLFFVSSKGFSQRRRTVENLSYYDQQTLHYGFILGLNQMTFHVKPKDNIAFKTYQFDPVLAPDITYDSLNVYGVESNPIPSFTVGIVGNLRLGEYFDLRLVPSLSLGERQIKYNVLVHYKGESRLETIKKRIPSVLVDIPLHLKYKSKRYNNMRGYVLAGPRLSLDLSSKSKAQKLNDNAAPSIVKNDLMMEFGVGFDFYTTYFKFGTEIKMSYGLTNIINHVVPEQNNINNTEILYTNVIDKVNSKIFQISFTFE